MLSITNIKKILFLLTLFFFVFNSYSQNYFIENKGQMLATVKAKISIPSGVLFLEDGTITYSFYSGKNLAEVHNLQLNEKSIDAHAFSMSFINCNFDISSVFSKKQKYFENYFLKDSNRWATEVGAYKQIRQNNVYKGIDVKYYVFSDKLKYDIIVARNTSTDDIKIRYDGAESISLKDGNIHVLTTVNRVVEYSPYAYQEIEGEIKRVECNYVLKKNVLTFDFPNGYNRDYELIIDPILEFSTYSGSSSDNFGYTATYDDFGFLYSGSTVFGSGYPTTIGAYQITYSNLNGGTDIVVTKYDTSGTQRIYSTYLGGIFDELPHSMIVNTADELYVFGTTTSADFPTTQQAFQRRFNGGPSFTPAGIGVSFPNGSDLFVSKINASGGQLLSSTFLGGSSNDGINSAQELKYNYADEVRGEIEIDKQNNIYIATCTESIDFPTRNSFQSHSNGDQEGCIIKMDSQLSTIIWSSYIGGESQDAIYSLSIDQNNDIYITGGTNSIDFPTTNNAYQKLYQDSLKADAFITKISSEGTNIITSSYFGTGSYDQAYFVDAGSFSNIYLFGQTEATDRQLIKNSSYFTLGGGQFIAVFNNDLSELIRSTVVGTGKGTPDISPTAFLVDMCNKIYVSGWGSSFGGSLSTLNLPITADAYQNTTDGNDFYLMVLGEKLDTVLYATYYGGSQSAEHVDGGTSRFDKKGIIYQSVCAGCGGNSDFPIKPNPGAVSSTNNSQNCNNGVFKFNFDFPIAVADFASPNIVCDSIVLFKNRSQYGDGANFNWDFGDGDTSNQLNPTHIFSNNGLYNVTLVVNDSSSCNVSDTISKTIYNLTNSSLLLDTINKCPGATTQIGLPTSNSSLTTYSWFPNLFLSSANISNPFCSSDSTISYRIIVQNSSCIDTVFQTVLVDMYLKSITDTAYCNTPILLEAEFSNNVTTIHWSSSVFFSDTLSSTSVLLIDKVGKYYVRVSNDDCYLSDSISVYSEQIEINTISSDVCIGDSIVLEAVNLNSETEVNQYLWNDQVENTPIIADLPFFSKWYFLIAITTDGCFLSDSIFINVYDYPIIDSAWASKNPVFKGEELTLNVQSADNIFWDEFQSTNYFQSVEAEISTCFNFYLNNEYNCTVRDSICIEVKDVFCNRDSIFIPTAFSPNKDEKMLNETYFIKDLTGVITTFKLEIFNRLGQKVFSSNDINKAWDGKYNGDPLAPQVFDFYLDVGCAGGKSLFHKGNITLIR